MAKTELPQQQKEILELLARNPQGAGIGLIRNNLADPPHKRTVQRWLPALAAGKYITVVGKGRATLYKSSALVGKRDNVSTEYVTGTREDREDYGCYIPLSTEGREIISYVKQNQVGRIPVGYERDFLAAYIPSKTWYLDESFRTHLCHIGDTGEQAHPVGTGGLRNESI